MQMNTFQIAAVKNYKGGHYAHLVAITDEVEMQTAIDKIDDNALHDIISGLGKLDPRVNTNLEAVSVLREAIRNARELEFAPRTFMAA